MRATARNFLGQGTSARPWDRLHPPPRCSLSNVPPFESLPAAKVWRPLETHLNSQVWDMARRLITFQSITILLQTRDVIAEPQGGSKTE
jgi:hypothetical protein